MQYLQIINRRIKKEKRKEIKKWKEAKMVIIYNFFLSQLIYFIY